MKLRGNQRAPETSHDRCCPDGSEEEAVRVGVGKGNEGDGEEWGGGVKVSRGCRERGEPKGGGRVIEVFITALMITVTGVKV